MKNLDFATDEMARVVEAGFRVLLEQIEEPQDRTVLRKFGKVYDTLSLEDIAGVMAVSGHAAGEEPPCDVCKQMAKSEMKLREE